MPLAHPIFFEEPREYTDEQIAELRAGGLLRDDSPVATVTLPNTGNRTAPSSGGPADPSKETK